MNNTLDTGTNHNQLKYPLYALYFKFGNLYWQGNVSGVCLTLANEPDIKASFRQT